MKIGYKVLYIDEFSKSHEAVVERVIEQPIPDSKKTITLLSVCYDTIPGERRAELVPRQDEDHKTTCWLPKSQKDKEPKKPDAEVDADALKTFDAPPFADEDKDKPDTIDVIGNDSADEPHTETVTETPPTTQ